MALKRGCGADLLALLAGHFHPAVLIEAEWHDGTHRVHSGAGELTWNGQTWLGIGLSTGAGGRLVDFTAPAEAEGMTADGGVVRVAATLETILSERGKLVRNKPLHTWFGAVTEPAGNVLAAEPVHLFTGYFDDRTFDFGRDGEDYTHGMTMGLGLGPVPRAKASVLHSAEDQQRAYPGDTAGRHVILANRREANPDQWPEP